MARLNAATAAGWDRFARWPRGWAIAALAGFALLLVLAALTYPSQFQGRSFNPRPGVPEAKRHTDLMLYDAIAQRVAKGDNYYHAAVEEQRARNFPVRPASAVRLPTFAFLTAWLGKGGLAALGVGIALAALLAWWRRLGEEPVGWVTRIFAMLLLAAGCALGARPAYWMLHEVWSGLFLALAFGLHRPSRWHLAWLAAAAALTIREHALPFVLLLGAMAAWRRDWRESAAWGGLALLFLTALAWHMAHVSALALPMDLVSPPWLVMRGLAGWTSNLVFSSGLNRFPGWLMAPLVLLPLIGWTDWRSAAGLTGTLLHTGYGVLFMLAGRDNNFYWALMVVPTWFIGLAFMPRALVSLTRAALGKR